MTDGSLSILLTCDHRRAVGTGCGRGRAAPDPDRSLCRGPPELLRFPSPGWAAGSALPPAVISVVPPALPVMARALPHRPRL